MSFLTLENCGLEDLPRLLAILGFATIIAGSLLRDKSWSQRLFNLRLLTMPVFFGVLPIIGAIIIASLVQSL